MMKKLALLLVCLVAASQFCRAQFAPSSFVGYVEYEQTSGGADVAFSIYTFGGDGTYALIYGMSRVAGPPGQQGPFYTTPQTIAGTYNYQVLGPNSASLRLAPSGAGRPAYTKTLSFSSPSHATGSASALSSDDANSAIREELLNVSTRTFLSSGKSSIAGFVISGTRSRWALVRAVGPGLKAYVVSATLADPQVTVYNSSGGTSPEWTAGSWRGYGTNQIAGLNSVMSLVGAFPIQASSDDAVLLVQVSPGVYTAVCQSVSGANQGEVLIEVYVLPWRHSASAATSSIYRSAKARPAPFTGIWRG